MLDQLTSTEYWKFNLFTQYDIHTTDIHITQIHTSHRYTHHTLVMVTLFYPWFLIRLFYVDFMIKSKKSKVDPKFNKANQSGSLIQIKAGFKYEKYKNFCRRNFLWLHIWQKICISRYAKLNKMYTPGKQIIVWKLWSDISLAW